MPAIKCESGKWKWGQNGSCVYNSKSEAEAAHSEGKSKGNYLRGQ